VRDSSVTRPLEWPVAREVRLERPSWLGWSRARRLTRAFFAPFEMNSILEILYCAENLKLPEKPKKKKIGIFIASLTFIREDIH
jgi:hypothetical protein